MGRFKIAKVAIPCLLMPCECGVMWGLLGVVFCRVAGQRKRWVNSGFGIGGKGGYKRFPKYVLESVLEECKFNVDERFHDELGLEREQVGYVTESQDKCCAETVLKYMTDFALVEKIELWKRGLIFKLSSSLQLANLRSLDLAKRTFLPARPSEHGLAGRKVLFATETSFSMEDVKYVVDSGYTEFQTYDRMLGVEYVKKTRISKAIGVPRALLGGNIKKPVMCYKMYTHDFCKAIEMRISPAFNRCKLDHVICLLKKLDQKFEFINPLNSANLESSIYHLKKFMNDSCDVLFLVSLTSYCL
ncbi:hypothetical protein Tco_1336280 [Tanacetum coccineum]